MPSVEIPLFLQEAIRNPSIDGFGYSPNLNVSSSDNVTQVKVRPRRRLIHDTIYNINILLNGHELDEFRKWWEIDLNKGTIPFKWDFPLFANHKIQEAIITEDFSVELFSQNSSDDNRHFLVSLRIKGTTINKGS